MTRLFNRRKAHEVQGPSQYDKDQSCRMVTDYLKHLTKIAQDHGESLHEKGRRSGLYAFELLNNHARMWQPRIKPADVAWGQPQQCFLNALMLAGMDSRYTYVEGWAYHIMPIHHAWVIDREGNVIDNTWDSLGGCYYGTPFRTDDVLRIAQETNTSSLMFNVKVGTIDRSIIDHKALKRALCN